MYSNWNIGHYYFIFLQPYSFSDYETNICSSFKNSKDIEKL